MIGALNIAILLVAVVLIFLANRWHCSRAQRILEHWAQSNGYEIVSSNHWEIITGQEVYSVTIRTAAGEIRTGQVRCGRWIVGTLANATSVRWDD
jgi:hypothetical protein